MIFSLVAMIGLEKCCITSAYLQWLCHTGEQAMALGPLVFFVFFLFLFIPRHTIVAGYYGFSLDVSVSVRPSVIHPSVRFSFQDDNLSKH